MSTRARHAIEAFEHDFAVVRLRPNSKWGFDSDFLDAPARDCGELVRWIEQDCNWGINPGASGIVVVDVDGPTGEQVFAAQSDALGALPPTLEVKSQRPEGGRHLYFRCADAASIVRTTPWLGKELDLLAGHTHAVGPGSSIDGREYAIVAGSFAEIATMPKPWHDRLKRRDSQLAHITPPLRMGGMGSHAESCGVMRSNVGKGADMVGTEETGVGDPFVMFALQRKGTTHAMVGQIVRVIRGRDPSASEPTAAHRDGLRRWHEDGRAAGLTETEWSEVLRQFMSYWDGWRADRAGEIVGHARDAASVELPARLRAMFPEGDPILRTAGLCAVLSTKSIDGKFWLAQRAGGDALNIPHRTVNNHLQLLRRFGFIEEVEKGSRASRKASTYRWRV